MLVALHNDRANRHKTEVHPLQHRQLRPLRVKYPQVNMRHRHLLENRLKRETLHHRQFVDEGGVLEKFAVPLAQEVGGHEFDEPLHCCSCIVSIVQSHRFTAKRGVYVDSVRSVLHKTCEVTWVCLYKKRDYTTILYIAYDYQHE